MHKPSNPAELPASAPAPALTNAHVTVAIFYALKSPGQKSNLQTITDLNASKRCLILISISINGVTNI